VLIHGQSFAEHFPEKTIAAAGLAVPSHTLEKGLEEGLKLVNRERYPEDQYPYGCVNTSPRILGISLIG
jgi:hypothetical protein